MSWDDLVSSQLGETGVAEGQMFGMPCLKAGSKVFAGLWEGSELVVKLPRERVDELLASGDGATFEPMAGRPMKEWVLIRTPDDRWAELADEARRFVTN